MAARLLQPVEISKKTHVVVYKFLTTYLYGKVLEYAAGVYQADFAPSFMDHKSIVCVGRNTIDG